MAQENTERLTISVGEASKLLGVSRASGYAAAQINAFPVLRVGRRLVVPRERFMRWLDGEEAGMMKPAAGGR